MFYSSLTKKALAKAAALHDGQHRKGPRHLPVITHLVNVAGTVALYRDDAEVIAAALLHDSIEDTEYTPEQLRDDFGESIASYVLGVTIPNVHDDSSHYQPAGGHAYYKNLATAPEQCMLIAAADKLDNFTSMLEDYADKPDSFRAVFGGTAEDREHFYQSVVDLVTPHIPEQLAGELNAAWQECLHKVVRV